MKQITMIYAAAAVAVGFLAFKAYRAKHPQSDPALVPSADTMRLSGVQTLYNSSAGQQAAVDRAVQENWKTLQDSVFATQPDFWV